MSKITVIVADAQHLFAEALGVALGRYPELEIHNHSPATGLEVIEVATTLDPDVVLLDFWMVGMEGPPTTRLLGKRAPRSKVLLLSWLHGPQQVEEALEAGAVGFLPKSLTLDQVAGAIRRAHAGESPVYSSELEELVRTIEAREHEVARISQRLLTLTPREIQILTMLSFGEPFDDVADKLSISPGTLRTHVHNILKKTGARSQIEAIAMARHYGLIQT
ncbi:MAG: response regulator [bacterium]